MVIETDYCEAISFQSFGEEAEGGVRPHMLGSQRRAKHHSGSRYPLVGSVQEPKELAISEPLSRGDQGTSVAGVSKAAA